MLKRIVKLVLDLIAFLVVLIPLVLTKLEERLTRADYVFRFWGDSLALVPGLLGAVVRGMFYRFALEECAGSTSIAPFVSIAHRQTRIGPRVVITNFTSVGRCVIGSDTGIGSGCHIISSKREHSVTSDGVDFSRPMKGSVLTIGSRVWIGDGCVIMADVGDGAVVGAGSVVTKPVPPRATVAGNPARAIGGSTEGN